MTRRHGLGTIIAEALWIALAIIVLFMRNANPPDFRGYATLVVLFLCTVALAIALKDSLVEPKWIWRINAAAVFLPLLFSLAIGLSISNTPIDPLWDQDLRP